jgi:hypothetical protein
MMIELLSHRNSIPEEEGKEMIAIKDSMNVFVFLITFDGYCK